MSDFPRGGGVFVPYSFPNETNEDRVKMFTVTLMGALASGIVVSVFEILLCAFYVYLRCQDRFDSWLNHSIQRSFCFVREENLRFQIMLNL
jgi:hypothetical protein